MKKIGDIKHSMKMMWGCVAFAIQGISI